MVLNSVSTVFDQVPRPHWLCVLPGGLAANSQELPPNKVIEYSVIREKKKNTSGQKKRRHFGTNQVKFINSRCSSFLPPFRPLLPQPLTLFLPCMRSYSRPLLYPVGNLTVFSERSYQGPLHTKTCFRIISYRFL